MAHLAKHLIVLSWSWQRKSLTVAEGGGKYITQEPVAQSTTTLHLRIVLSPQ